MLKANLSTFKWQSRESEVDELLAAGQSTSAKFAAMEWIAQQPRRPETRWALAKAHYQLGELAAAKEVLRGLLQVAPDERYRVDDWLSHVEDEFRDNRPKPA